MRSAPPDENDAGDQQEISERSKRAPPDIEQAQKDEGAAEQGDKNTRPEIGCTGFLVGRAASFEQVIERSHIRFASSATAATQAHFRQTVPADPAGAGFAGGDRIDLGMGEAFHRENRGVGRRANRAVQLM